MIINPYRFATAEGYTGFDRTDWRAWWQLNETSGTRADEYGSNTLADNNTVLYATGKQGNAADFEDTNAEYLSIADNANVSFGDEDFTVGCWVKLESKAQAGLIAKWNAPGSDREWMLYYNVTVDRFVFTVSSNGVLQPDVQWGSAPSTGTWYFVLGWHDSVNNEIALQVNNLAPVTTSTSAGVNDGGTGLFLGRFVDGASNNHDLDGLMDEAFMVGRVLTPNERALLYNDGDGVPWATLQNMFDGVGSEAINRATSQTFGYTFIDKANSATVDGEITAVDLWFATSATGVKVGSFVDMGSGVYICRDWDTIGAVGSGQVFSDECRFGIQAGEYVGVYWGSGTLELDTTGGDGVAYYNADQMGGAEDTFTEQGAWGMSLHAGGIEKTRYQNAWNFLGGADTGGLSGYTVRQWIDATSIYATGGTKIKITFHAADAEAFYVDGVRIAPRNMSGDNYDYNEAPTTVTFGGGNTFSLAAGESITSDEIDFVVPASGDLVISYYVTGTTSQDGMRYHNLPTTRTAPYWKSGTDLDTQNASGYTAGTAGQLLGMLKLEVYK